MPMTTSSSCSTNFPGGDTTMADVQKAVEEVR